MRGKPTIALVSWPTARSCWIGQVASPVHQLCCHCFLVIASTSPGFLCRLEKFEVSEHFTNLVYELFGVDALDHVDHRWR